MTTMEHGENTRETAEREEDQRLKVDPVTKVARDLREIETLARSLSEQAVAKANDKTLPGGAAMVALGPEADLDEWAEQIAAAELKHLTDPIRFGYPRHVEDEDDQDHEPPLQTLLFWSEQWREELGYPLEGRRPTLLTEAAFLRNIIGWAWDNEPHFEDCAADVNQARRRLEDTLTAGYRSDRTRVRCTNGHCETKPSLIVTKAPRVLVGWRCRCSAVAAEVYRCDSCNRRWPPSAARACPGEIGKKDDRRPCEGKVRITLDLDACPACQTFVPPEPVWFSRTDDDGWKCPGCKRRYDRDDYQAALAEQLRSEGADKFVDKPDAVSTLRAQGRSERTIRKWLGPMRVQVASQCRGECGQRHEGVVLVCCKQFCRRITAPDVEAVVVGYCDLSTRKTRLWWPDLWRMHRATKTRERKSA